MPNSACTPSATRSRPKGSRFTFSIPWALIRNRSDAVSPISHTNAGAPLARCCSANTTPRKLAEATSRREGAIFHSPSIVRTAARLSFGAPATSQRLPVLPSSGRPLRASTPTSSLGPELAKGELPASVRNAASEEALGVSFSDASRKKRARGRTEQTTPKVAGPAAGNTALSAWLTAGLLSSEASRISSITVGRPAVTVLAASRNDSLSSRK